MAVEEDSCLSGQLEAPPNGRFRRLLEEALLRELRLVVVVAGVESFVSASCYRLGSWGR